MKIQILALTAAVALAGALPAAAQPLHERQTRQAERIEQGVRSGELTPHEARRLQIQHHRLVREERELRRHQGGRLTVAQRRHLERQLDHQNREIARLKHNDRTY